MAKCPNCKSEVHDVKTKLVSHTTPAGRKVQVVLHSCPSCDVILPAMVDPVLLAEQIIAAVRARG